MWNIDQCNLHILTRLTVKLHRNNSAYLLIYITRPKDPLYDCAMVQFSFLLNVWQTLWLTNFLSCYKHLLNNDIFRPKVTTCPCQKLSPRTLYQSREPRFKLRTLWEKVSNKLGYFWRPESQRNVNDLGSFNEDAPAKFKHLMVV